MTRPASRLAMALLLLLVAATMGLQGGSLPHLHAGAGLGLYNAEHDLTLLAALAGSGLPADSTALLPFDVVSTAVLAFTPERPLSDAVRSGDSRAPPSA
jgi:hypothetical protein